ncbi:MAG TPA: peptide ABC transporter substrate-binding protein [Candidatus Elarobacter sp.]|jgi:peptide/nickel transport system substrate-binding protein
MKKLTAAALAALLIAGCTKVAQVSPSGSSSAGTGAGGRHPYTVPHVLRYATAEDIVGLNPHLSQQTVLSYMSSLTMAWLVKFDHENRPVPELATAVPTPANGGISKDGLTITYHLRKDAKWSDGVPFTADDVVFSTKVVLNPANNEVSRDGWDLITKIDEPDKYTVVYHLKKRYAPYVASYFSSGGANPSVLPVHILGGLPNINNAPYNALPVGIGPFKYASWKRSDSVTMVPDPLYFRGRPKLQKITFKIVPDRNTVMTQLETHEIDLWTPVAAAFYDRVKGVPGVAVLKQPGYGFNHLDFQTQHPGLDDPRVRRALRMGIDRDELKQKIRHGLGIVQDDPISPAHPSFDNAVPTDRFDLDAAGKLLDEAGWTMRPDGVRAKNGHAMSFVFATSTGTPDADSMIELIRANWKKLGVTFTVRRYPSPMMFAPFADNGVIYGGKWDFVVFGWGGDPIGDLSLLYSCNTIPPKGQNDPRYCNRAVTDAMEKFKTEYDPQKRQPYADAVQSGIAKDAPIVVTSIQEDIYAYNADLRGFTPNQLTPFDDFLNVDI